MEALSTEPVMRATDVQAILRLVGGAAEMWYTPALQRQFKATTLAGRRGEGRGVRGEFD